MSTVRRPALRLWHWIAAALAVLVGVLAVVSGESDDSPGLQGLGCILILLAAVATLRTHRRSPHPEPSATTAGD